MEKVIGIIDGTGGNYDSSTLETTGLGGSETWTVQLSMQFKSRGYHVIIFNGTDNWHFDKYGIEWVPLSFFKSRIKYQSFDRIIISRIYNGYIDAINKESCCWNIYVQAHDVGIGQFDWENNCYPKLNGEGELFQRGVKKVIALSEWHIESLNHIWNDIPRDMVETIPDGIDPELFKDIRLDNHRDNGILFSSRPERGMELLCNKILPELRKVVGDAKVYLASYNDIPKEYYDRENDGIYVLGRLNKIELYKEMSKHKVWFYPSIFPETFNITLCENIMCGCIPVLPLIHGMATTLRNFNKLGIDHEFYNPWYTPNGNDDLAVKDSVQMLSGWMNNWDNYATYILRDSMRNFITENYSWSKVADLWENLFNKY